MVVDLGQGDLGFGFADVFLNAFDVFWRAVVASPHALDAVLVDLDGLPQVLLITLPTPPDVVRRAVELLARGRSGNVKDCLVLGAITAPLPTARDLVGKPVSASFGIRNARNALVAKHRPLDLFLHIKGHSTQAFLPGGAGLGQGHKQQRQQQDQPVHVVVSSGVFT
ncbi:hypothetical protein FQZ97_944120 [compost metagenome]